MKDSDGHDAVWWARECREDLGLGQINYLVKSNEKWAADNLAGFPKSRAEDLDREQPGLGSSETLAARHVLGRHRIQPHPAAPRVVLQQRPPRAHSCCPSAAERRRSGLETLQQAVL